MRKTYSINIGSIIREAGALRNMRASGIKSGYATHKNAFAAATAAADKSYECMKRRGL